MEAFFAICLFAIITLVNSQSCPSGQSPFMSGDGTPLVCSTTKANSCPTNYACRKVAKNIPQYRSLCCGKKELVSDQSASCPPGESPFLSSATNTPHICSTVVPNSCPFGFECRTVPGNAAQYRSLCCLPSTQSTQGQNPTCSQGTPVTDNTGSFINCGISGVANDALCPSNYRCTFDGVAYGCCATQAYNCMAPYDSGTICESSSSATRWYFDWATGKCQMFNYNGCDGNGNNFDSQSACTQSCGSLTQSQSDGRVGSSCNYNTDCITGSECNSGMCACRSDRVAIDGYCYLNFPTETA